ncbi:MAG: glutamate--tRNA ligase, partial [Candidatus Eremiobacteraeota bacterium]|nr:glutamate--tRNA ligase [Candidatus Eremiobacteraeota bacterium]
MASEARPRVRFAPSPTGFLHVGGARTALFNWLFARRHGGTYVLRVEDTDVSRERPEYREEIFRALRWLGLDHDEGPDVGGSYGPYNQRERFDGYRAALQTLKARGLVYACFCASRAEDDTRVAQDDEPEQKSPRCECASLGQAELARRSAGQDVPAYRFRIDQTKAHPVDDLVRGHVEFPPGEVEDFIVTKAGGDPLYNFAAVVDDAAMHITHVIRGEEHLANTPKQIALYEALGLPVPQFAHLPILLNAERRKLSKRDGATGVSEYRALGYLADAMV